jgi:hypothetical protein
METSISCGMTQPTGAEDEGKQECGHSSDGREVDAAATPTPVIGIDAGRNIRPGDRQSNRSARRPKVDSPESAKRLAPQDAPSSEVVALKTGSRV